MDLNGFSLDSHLAAPWITRKSRVPFASKLTTQNIAPDSLLSIHRTFRAQAWANRYWNSTTPFTHAKFGGYLVTRLDGYTEADAKALTTRALQSEEKLRDGKVPKGEILLNATPWAGWPDRG